MDIAKKVAGLLIVALLSSTSWGMKESKGNWVSSNDIAIQIFQYLNFHELALSLIVCTNWKGSVTDDRLWAVFAKRLSGADKFKEKRDSWKQAAQKWATADLRILSMAEWRAKELEYALSDEGFVRIEGLLLEKMKQTIIKGMPPIADNRDFLAAFSAYYVVAISAPWDAARCAAGSALWRAAWDATYAARNAAWEPMSNAGWNYYPDGAAKKAAWNCARDAAWKAAWYAARDAAKDAAGDTVNKTLALLRLKRLDPFGAGWKLSSLYVLAYVAQDEYFDNHFMNAFSAARIALDREQLSQPVGEIFSVIAAGTWDRQELAKSPHVAMLKVILETFAAASVSHF